MADLDVECACGRAFPDEATITAHILEAFPPHANQPLDGRYHADVSESWPHIKGYYDQFGQPPPRTTHAKCRQMYIDVTQMLSHRPYLSQDLADGLAALGQQIALRLRRWDFEIWTSDPDPALRAAAAIAHRIDTRDIILGQRLHPDRLATQYQVPQAIIRVAIITLLEHGYLTNVDGRIEAAQRQVTTGVFLPERSEQYRRPSER